VANSRGFLSGPLRIFPLLFLIPCWSSLCSEVRPWHIAYDRAIHSQSVNDPEAISCHLASSCLCFSYYVPNSAWPSKNRCAFIGFFESQDRWRPTRKLCYSCGSEVHDYELGSATCTSVCCLQNAYWPPSSCLWTWTRNKQIDWCSAVSLSNETPQQLV
jgi:hypothetical protein